MLIAELAAILPGHPAAAGSRNMWQWGRLLNLDVPRRHYGMAARHDGWQYSRYRCARHESSSCLQRGMGPDAWQARGAAGHCNRPHRGGSLYKGAGGRTAGAVDCPLCQWIEMEIDLCSSHNLSEQTSLTRLCSALQTSLLATLQHSAPVWQVSWNVFGNWFAASTEDAEVCMWRPDLSGEWKLVHRIVGGAEPQPLE